MCDGGGHIDTIDIDINILHSSRLTWSVLPPSPKPALEQNNICGNVAAKHYVELILLLDKNIFAVITSKDLN